MISHQGFVRTFPSYTFDGMLVIRYCMTHIKGILSLGQTKLQLECQTMNAGAAPYYETEE